MEVFSPTSIVGPRRQEWVILELVGHQFLAFVVVLLPLVFLPLFLQGLDNFVDPLVDLPVIVPEPNLGFTSLELFGRTVVDSMDPYLFVF